MQIGRHRIKVLRQTDLSVQRIFIGFSEIAGYYGNLSSGLRSLGHPVVQFGAGSNIFAYKVDEVRQPAIAAIYDDLCRKRSTVPVGRIFRKYYYIIAIRLMRLCALFWSLGRHDVYIFSFGTSFLPWHLDLPFLRLLNKRVISCIAHGSEARPPFIDGGRRDINSGEFMTVKKLASLTKQISRRMKFIERHSDIVVAAGMTAHFLEKPFINAYLLGLPYGMKPARLMRADNPPTVRILHSPSHPAAKGTERIRQAIASLKKKGHRIEYIEIIGQPNDVVLRELQNCDFVVDQLYSDTPMAGFAAEAAFHGKPAIVGGYGWDILKKIIPAEAFPPTEICHPDEIESAMEKLISSRSYRLALGKRACDFVTSRWHAQAVAEKYVRLMIGDIPPDWWFRPQQAEYVHGCALSEKEAKALTAGVVDHYGPAALQLDDKPDLRRKFLEFADRFRER